MRKLYYIIALALILYSCNNYLDVKPRGKVIPETDEEFEAVLNEMLYTIEVGGNTDYIMGSAADVLDYEATTDNLDATAKVGDILVYAGNNLNSRQSTHYPALYRHIRDCNIILDGIKNKNSDLAKDMAAACNAIKGVCYYNLLRNFCEPYDPANAENQLGFSIVDDFNLEVYQDRSDLKKSAEYIISLFNKALEHNITSDKYIFTPDVINAFLAKTYFWIQDWENALSLSEELVKKYPLVEGEKYKEMIMAENGDRVHEVIVRSFSKGDPRSDLYYRNATRQAKTRPVNKKFIDLFANDNNNDIRYVIFFDKIYRTNAKVLTSMVRSSELSLMIAECYVHMRENDKALSMLNQIRSKRITSVVDYTMETLPEVNPNSLLKVDAKGEPLTKLLAAILEERQKELFMEGDRWFEMKRNGRPEYWVLTNYRKYTTYKYLYTFPINRADADLAGIVQNPGYIY